MAVRLPQRRLCGTAEAAEIYGCTQPYIRMLVLRGELWSQKVSERVILVDADEVRRLAAERAKLRLEGKLGGRRPVGRKTA